MVIINWKLEKPPLNTQDAMSTDAISFRVSLNDWVGGHPFYLEENAVPLNRSYEMRIYPEEHGIWSDSWNYTLTVVGVSLIPANDSLILELPSPTLTVQFGNSEEGEDIIVKTATPPLLRVTLFYGVTFSPQDAFIFALFLILVVTACYFGAIHRLNKALQTQIMIKEVLEWKEQLRLRKEREKLAKSLNSSSSSSSSSPSSSSSSSSPLGSAIPEQLLSSTRPPARFKAKPDRRRFVNTNARKPSTDF